MQDTSFIPTQTWREEVTETFKLSWPLALANLLQMLTYMIDVMFIARLGQEQLAASALSVSLFGLILWALTGLVGAVSPLIAEIIGTNGGATHQIRRSTRMALWLGLISGSMGMGLCLLLDPIMRATNQSAIIIEMANEYNVVIIFSMVPMLLAAVLRSYVAALGRPIFATAITGLGIGINALANYAFIFGNFGAPELGLEGAAVATIITALVVLLAYVIAIARNHELRRFRIFHNFWKPDWKRLNKIIFIGMPIALTVTAEAGIFGAAAFMMGRFGAAELAGHTVALQLAALAFQVPYGVGQAATIRVGYYYGAADHAGIRRSGWAAIAIGVCFMTITASAMLVVPEILLSIYVDLSAPENEIFVTYALQYLLLAAIFQLADGVQAVSAGALRGLQDTKTPMWIAIFAYWGPGFILAIWLGFFSNLQGVGVWIGLATGLFVAAGLLIVRWVGREKLGLLQRLPKKIS